MFSIEPKSKVAARAARSQNLTPGDFSCGATVRESVSHQVATIDQKLERIRNARACVTPKMLFSVGQECVKRWLACFEKGCAHFWSIPATFHAVDVSI